MYILEKYRDYMIDSIGNLFSQVDFFSFFIIHLLINIFSFIFLLTHRSFSKLYQSFGKQIMGSIPTV